MKMKKRINATSSTIKIKVIGVQYHYGYLRSYAMALANSNERTTVKLGKSYNFKWLFPKEPNSGKILTTVGRDGNNHIFPVAWAVVTIENKDNWSWFLDLLADDLEVPNGNGLTLISDQHKGLIEAVKEIMPLVEHRQCARHIYEGFRKQFGGVEFRLLFWAASKTTYPQLFQKIYEKIKRASPKAHDYLMKKNPKTWSRAHFNEGMCCVAVENEFSECFNSVLNGEICPNIQKILELKKDQQRFWHVISCGGNLFEVRKGSDAFRVDEPKKTCSCRMWQLSGLPCCHAIACIFRLNRMVEGYVPQCFMKDRGGKTKGCRVFPTQRLGRMAAWFGIDPANFDTIENTQAANAHLPTNNTQAGNIPDQSHYLERPFLMEEVKGAVWGCGLNKSPGPDGFTFEFYRSPWLKRQLVTLDVWRLISLFLYLGIIIGGNMSRIKSWDDVINKVLCRLSKWKMKILSIGGRFTLLKSVLGASPLYFMSMLNAPIQVLKKLESIRNHFFNGVDSNVRKMMLIKWDNVLAYKEKGGLGVSSFYALNRALTFKWIWRFRTQGSSLWSRVIKLIHGEYGKIGKSFKHGLMSNWNNITRGIAL
nr:pentatricopeptide repeat-containing protein [Tanacetum cinerariifolium]GEX21071.1 pentatricopeptide repeat-containing protein [Tanacetum cinerariifolium]